MSKASDNEALALAVQKWVGVAQDSWGGIETMAAFLEKTGQTPVKPSPTPAAGSGFTLTARDLSRMEGVDARLVAIVKRAAEITEVQFMVTEGLRTKERQKQLVASGASQTMDSRHIIGQAVDVAAVVNGEVRWDWPLYPRIAKAFKAAATEQGKRITWGGDWKSLRDGPHFQIEP